MFPPEVVRALKHVGPGSVLHRCSYGFHVEDLPHLLQGRFARVQVSFGNLGKPVQSVR